MTMHQCSCGPLLLLLSVALCHVVGAKQVILTNADNEVRQVDLNESTIIRDNEYFRKTKGQFLQFQQEDPLPSRLDGQAVLTTSFKLSEEDGDILYYVLIHGSKKIWTWGRENSKALIPLHGEVINSDYRDIVISIVSERERGVFVEDGRDLEHKAKLFVVSVRTTLKTNFQREKDLRNYFFEVRFDSRIMHEKCLYGLNYQDAAIRLMSSPSRRTAHLRSGDTDYGTELCRDKLSCQQINKGWQIITCRILDASSRWVGVGQDPTKMVTMSILVGNKLLAGTGEGYESVPWENIVEAKVAASDREWTVKQMMYADDQAAGEDEPAGEGQVGDYYTATLRVKYNVPEDTSVTCIIVEPLYGKIHGTETPRRAVYHLHAEPPPPSHAMCKGYTGGYKKLRKLDTSPATPRRG